MNKNVVGIILIIIALALVWFYGWPKMKPYISPPEVPTNTGPTTGTIPI
jgi:hypothetical protein